MRLPWIMRRFDQGRKMTPRRPAFLRSLVFEQMEERLTLSTTMAPLTVDNVASLEGGWISFGSDQVLIGDSRGVLDSDGLSGFEFSQIHGTGNVLNYQGTPRGNVDASSPVDGNFLFGTNSNESLLGGGLEQVTPIEPLEQTPPDQPDGGHIQIARLFAPSFEQHTSGATQGELAKTPDLESYRDETRNLTPLRELTPAQGREMAFEVASTAPSTATSNSQISFNNAEAILRKASSTAEAKVSEIPRQTEVATPAHPGTDVLKVREELPATQMFPVSITAKPQTVHNATPDSVEAVRESARDQVFSEWEKQQPAGAETPTAPLAKDREREMTHKLVLSGMAILSAGIHYMRSHNRAEPKEFNQIPTEKE